MRSTTNLCKVSEPFKGLLKFEHFCEISWSYSEVSCLSTNHAINQQLAVRFMSAVVMMQCALPFIEVLICGYRTLWAEMHAVGLPDRFAALINRSIAATPVSTFQTMNVQLQVILQLGVCHSIRSWYCSVQLIWNPINDRSVTTLFSFIPSTVSLTLQTVRSHEITVTTEHRVWFAYCANISTKLRNVYDNWC